MQRHPLSAAFPDMPEDDFAALVADVKAHGLREHGWLYEGAILDGWHRYRACEAAGVKFRYEEYRGSDPVAFVKSRNLERRHLTASQRAAAIVACHNWRPRGRENKSFPGKDLTPTAAVMAKEAGVSVSTIENAKVAVEAGLGEAVRDGAISARQAAEAAKGSPERKDPRDRRIAELEAANERLREEIDLVREGAQEAVVAAETAAALLDTEPAKVLAKYKAEITRLERLRDDLLNQNGQLVRQVKALQRKLDRAERAAA